MGQPGKQRVGTQVPKFADTSLEDVGGLPGVYLGVIKQINTASRDGSLNVYVAAFGGDEDVPSSWRKVVYASPFLGTTTGPPGEPQLNSYLYTKQTYGFYMSPPDVGNQVLCCFPTGVGSIGFWFACVNFNLGQAMIPAGGSVPWNSLDPASFADPSIQSLLPYLKQGTPYPAGEFNENDKAVWVSNWAKNKRPINPIATFQLISQGLDQDPARGAISSSVQRDPVSTVFGFNTPGRPVPSQDPKNDPQLRQKLTTGNFNPEDLKVTTRVGGHNLTMDDGDIYGDSQLVRLKTAAGHQIMMNDSEGFIYVANSAGTAWVELTKTGDILVYSGKDLSIRTEGNLMMHSDNNISINAARSLHLHSPQVVLEGSQVLSATGGQLLNLYGGVAQVKSRSSMAISSGGLMSVKASGVMALNGSQIALNGGGGGGEVAPPARLPQFLSADAVPSNIGWEIQTNRIQSICYRIPTHEPYIRGSVSAVIKFQEDAAASANAVTSLSVSPPVTTVEGEAVTPPTLGPSASTEQAATQPVSNPAPSSSFIAQTPPNNDLGILNQDQYRAYLAQTAWSGSQGQYTPTTDSGVDGVTSAGQVGKYQLDSTALQVAGLVRPGTPSTAEAINNPNNWIGGPNKPNSLQDFLASPQTQETAMNTYTTNNYAELQKNGVITSSTPVQEVAGLLSAAHIQGAQAATIWYTGGDTRGVNTEALSSFYQQGRYSQTQVGVIVASNNSKTVQGV